MKRMNLNNLTWTYLITLIVVLFSTCMIQAGQTTWRQEDVDWRMTGGDRITAIRYPEQGKPPFFEEQSGIPPKIVRKHVSPRSARPEDSSWGLFGSPTVMANLNESPPIGGFIPWIAIAVTDERSDDFDWVAQTHTSVVGQYLTDSPETDFAIGLFDTGGGIHFLSQAAANRTGIYDADLLTSNTVEFAGASSSVFAWISRPLGVFMDGLAAVDPNTMTVDDSNMVGQSNVSIGVGDMPAPGISVMGAPMGVNFVATIDNTRPITVTYDGNDYTAPDIRFYEHGDARIPTYANAIPLKLIPSGAVNIQYIIDYEAIFEFVFEPGTPSVIVGNSAQSLFFVDSVDLYDETQSAIDKGRFILDTGAQVTVISSGIGSRLGLDPANPDFEVDITDSTGAVEFYPGFFIDSLEIPALGQWLVSTDVPVVLLDLPSPEGGFLDGIIGMNLFVNYNLVLRGGGLMGQDPPSLEYEIIPSVLTGDIAPAGGDGVVDVLDLEALADAWGSTADAPNWNPAADIAPQPVPDGIVNYLDLAAMMENWLKGTTL